MGDLRNDTAVESLGKGRFGARLSPDWQLVGPNGGYLASLALRAAGAHCGFPRPASLSCHYLSVAQFKEVELQVTPLQSTRRAESLRVHMTQDGKPVLEALVWAVADVQGPEESWLPKPEVAAPLELDTMTPGGPGFAALPFWQNLEIRPAFLEGESHEPGGAALIRAWGRYRPTGTFADDAWLDACRYVVYIDAIQFGAIAMSATELTFLAPSLDVYIAFHRPAPRDEFLLVEARGLGAEGGLLGSLARIWSPGGNLVASGTQQMLWRPLFRQAT